MLNHHQCGPADEPSTLLVVELCFGDKRPLFYVQIVYQKETSVHVWSLNVPIISRIQL